MTAFMQMGHHTENLVGEKGLQNFGGIILSPVNRAPDQLKEDVARYRTIGDYEILFDPQLYAPRADRGRLPEYEYFPTDVDTADLGSTNWWNQIVEVLANTAGEIGADTVAAPVIVPKIWSDEYLSMSMQVADRLSRTLNDQSVYATCLVSMSELTDRNRRLQLASMFSQPEVAGYYIVFYADTEPRRELRDADELAGSLKFVRLLQGTERDVLVGYTGSDMLLYKAAGATHCSTGKFFNLRRFTKSRFEEPPAGGGGQLAYWFEEGLLAFLRDADLQRIRSRLPGLVMQGASDNRWSHKILTKLDSSSGAAWLGDSWRQYLSWFAAKEAVVERMTLEEIDNELRAAEARWDELANHKILMDERHNDGGWIRAWRQAVADLAA